MSQHGDHAVTVLHDTACEESAERDRAFGIERDEDHVRSRLWDNANRASQQQKEHAVVTCQSGHINVQNHGNAVSFRNICIESLD